MTKPPPTLHVLRPEDTSDIAAAVAKLKREMVQIAEYNKQMAKIVRSEYEAYIEAGFTKAEAMQLVKAKLAPPAKGSGS